MVESASMDASLVDLEIFVIPHARTIVMNRDALAKVNVTGASLDGLVYSVNVEVIVLNSDCVTKMEGEKLLFINWIFILLIYKKEMWVFSMRQLSIKVQMKWM